MQGVGFRYSVLQVAKEFDVAGFVSNLADGRVQLLVEGKEEDVKKFLLAIRKRWPKNIEKEQTEEKQPTGKFHSFSIMRCIVPAPSTSVSSRPRR